MKEIEKNIRYYCGIKNISIPELAKKIEMSFSGLYSSIRNDTLKTKTLQKIADVFNIKVYDLFYEKENTTISSIKNFMDYPLLDFLSKRTSSLNEKIAFYKDYFIWSILQNLPEFLEVGPPFPDRNKQDTLLSQNEFHQIQSIPLKTREIPYSQWQTEYKSIIDNTNILIESFYFIMFYYNFLNITDYLNDNMINKGEINIYWKRWKKMNGNQNSIIIEYLE